MGDAALSYRVWPLRRPTPGESKPLPAGTLALDRDLLEVHDNSVSRTSNAPVLIREGTRLTLEVNLNSAQKPLVIEGRRFDDLQNQLPPEDKIWKLPPGALSEPSRMVRSTGGTLVLVPSFYSNQETESHCLMTLGRVQQVEQGASIELSAPCTVVVGGSALDIVPEDTGVPASVLDQQVMETTRLLPLREVELKLAHVSQLDGFEVPSSDRSGSFRVPAASGGESLPAAALTAARLLRGRPGSWRFVPVIKDRRIPLLGLVYLPDHTGHASAGRLLISGNNPHQFVARLLDHLQRAPAAVNLTSNAFTPPLPAQRKPGLPEPVVFGALATRNPAFASKVEKLASVAEQNISVLLLGESGTGKEFVASELHRHSPRKAKPFVAVNCGGLSRELIESELFGHVRGAFTGAERQRTGAFVTADGGTLLLDEIGDAPMEVQVALLRALETRRIKPVGADREQPVDVRLMAATSRDLKKLVGEGRFRTDLYYRLEQVTVRLPALRQRPEDIPHLAEQILSELEPDAKLSSEALDQLARHPFYGNVRELKNTLYRALTLSPKNEPIPAAAVAIDSEISETVRPPELGELPPALPNPGLWFPRDVVALGQAAFSEGQVPKEDQFSKFEVRTRARAALLYLKTEYPFEAWPRTLITQYHRLFGDRWASTEDERGLKSLMRLLGLSYRDANAIERVLELV